jgi:hypothetical protein
MPTCFTNAVPADYSGYGNLEPFSNEYSIELCPLQVLLYICCPRPLLDAVPRVDVNVAEALWKGKNVRGLK